MFLIFYKSIYVLYELLYLKSDEKLMTSTSKIF